MALPIDPDHRDCFDPGRFRHWFAAVGNPGGPEHAVLSDGYHHIRIDVDAGSIITGQPVLLRYRMMGIVDAEAKLLPLRRLIALSRTGRFSRTLFPPDRRIDRWLDALRVHDALRCGASQREIAIALFGQERIPSDWRAASDSLRSRVRRLIRDAHRLAGGGYRKLLGRDD